MLCLPCWVCEYVTTYVFQVMAGQEESKDKHQHLVGICMGMCPNAEVRLRQREKMIHPLEMALDSNGQRLNYPQVRAMVKMFSRPAAGQQVKAADVRPVPVLMKTLRYLLANVCCRKDVPWALVYQFVSDRLQAIRQDLCVQRARNLTALQIYQAVVRTCEHELKDFDPFLNMKQLLDTLFLVMSLYQELDLFSNIVASDKVDLTDYTSFSGHDEESEEEDSDSDSKVDDGAETKIVQDSKASEKSTSNGGETTSGLEEDSNTVRHHDDNSSGSDSVRAINTQEREKVLPSERENKKHYDGDIVSCSSLQEEGVALYLLVNLGNEEAIMNAMQLHHNIKCSKLVSLTLEMNLAWLTYNYYRVLKLSTCLPPLCQCAFHIHLTVIQRKSLGILNQSHSCKGQSYSLEQLSEMLLYNNSDHLAQACTHYGLPAINGGVIFTKGKFDYEAPLMKPCHTRRIEDQLAAVPLPDLLLPTLNY
ncbi:uncharacterized protein LOC123519532 isoform X3 [Portunus trituberculatus]|uniref:uncharacterized protein LOC123519532 isoform X3 n=1 Tax=Portunus trituberculatus TaxID=210409 RepID=UPI001E1D0F86|nr:uncharacterized protein LOC123519532 isoform X3 [Portunus trituberculatus]